MKQPVDVTWDALGVLWREQRPEAVVPAGLARRVRANTRLMRVTVCTEVGLFLGLAVVSRWYLGDSPSAPRIMVLALLWLLNIGIEAFSIWNRRGSWRADAETTEAYLDLLGRRARAKVRAAQFVRVAALLQSLAVVALVWVDALPRGADDTRRVLTAAGIGTALMAGYGIWSSWYERRARSELAQATAARRLMEESGGET